MVKILAYNIFDEKIWLELPDNGELTPEARWIFSNGHCHSFALAIRKLTGWKLVVKNHKNLRGQINHVLVAVGNRTPLTLIDSEKTLVLPDRSPGIEGVTYKFRGRGWLKAEVEIALPFARTRLAELEHESGNAHYPVRHPALVMKLKPKSKSMARAQLKTATNKQLVKLRSQYTALLQVYRNMPVETLRACSVRESERRTDPNSIRREKLKK